MTAGASSRGLRHSTARPPSAIVGIYAACVYLASLPGGWVADRCSGCGAPIWYGGILIALGHLSIALSRCSRQHASSSASCSIVARHRTAQAEHLARSSAISIPRADARRDAGFSIFYMGINIGRLRRPAHHRVSGAGRALPRHDRGLGDGSQFGWHWGFGAAGVGMMLGLLQYAFGGRAARTRRDIELQPAEVAGTRGEHSAAGDLRVGRRSASPRVARDRHGDWRASNHRRTRHGRATRTCSLAIAVGFFSWLFLRRRLDAGGEEAAVSDRRLLLRRRTLLVGVRAGADRRSICSPRLHRPETSCLATVSSRAAGGSRSIRCSSSSWRRSSPWLWVKLGHRGRTRRARRSSRLAWSVAGLGFLILVIPASADRRDRRQGRR